MPRSVGWYISTFRDILSRWDRWTVPKHRYLSTNQRCVTFQWSWDLTPSRWKPEVSYILMSCAVCVFPRLKFLKTVDRCYLAFSAWAQGRGCTCSVWERNGLNCLRIGTTDGILEARRWTFGCHRGLWIPWRAERVPVSEPEWCVLKLWELVHCWQVSHLLEAFVMLWKSLTRRHGPSVYLSVTKYQHLIRSLDFHVIRPGSSLTKLSSRCELRENRLNDSHLYLRA